jgi:hypothetical protein
MPRRVTHFATVLCLVFGMASPANAMIRFHPPASYPVGTVPTAVATVPALSPGTVRITVNNPDGRTYSFDAAFIVQ